MHYLIRTWTAFAVLGAGLIHLAVAASAPPALLAGFTVIGIAELAWAALALGRGRFPLPRATPPLLLVPLAVWAVAVTAGTDSAVMPPLSLAAATLLDVAAAVAVAWHGRRTGPVVPREPGAPRVVIGLVAGALAMSAIALPAIGQTSAGIAASNGPHSHGGVRSPIDLDHGGH